MEILNYLAVVILNGQLNSKGYSSTIEKMKVTFNTWYLRSFTLMDKILIINTLMSSLFVYKMLVLPNMDNRQVVCIEKLCNEFIWKGKRPKIKMSVLQNPKHKGGLKLVNFATKQKSLKLSWIKRIDTNPELQYIYEWLVPMLGKNIWKVNLSTKHINMFVKWDSNWHRILYDWCDAHYTEEFVGEEVKTQILWLNSNILVDGKPLLKEKCTDRELLCFSDLFDSNGKCMTYAQIQCKHGDAMTWLRTNCCNT